MDTIKEGILESVYRCAGKRKLYYLFFKPDMPKRRLKNLIKNFADGVQEEDVFALFDSTLWGRGKTGMMMTYNTLYACSKEEGAKQIDILDIKNVSIYARSKEGAQKQIDLSNIENIPVESGMKWVLGINDKDFHKFTLGAIYEAKWFRDALLGVFAFFESRKRNALIEKKIENVRNRAQQFWLNKPDPKNGGFICDACNSPILEKAGTSLLGSYMRCRDCTNKLFSRWYAGED